MTIHEQKTNVLRRADLKLETYNVLPGGKVAADIYEDLEGNIRVAAPSAGGSIDHGDLSGLSDDDHTQYALVDGSRLFTSPAGGVVGPSNWWEYIRQVELDSTVGVIAATFTGLLALKQDLLAYYSATINCNDGETFWRVTISNAAILGTEEILLLGIRRTAGETDETYIYTANVVAIAAGSFTVEIAALDEDGEYVTDVPPNETIKLFYQRAIITATP